MTEDHHERRARYLVRTKPGVVARRVSQEIAAAQINQEPRTKDWIEHLINAMYAAGRCSICGRKLTDPESKARAIGRECMKKHGAGYMQRFIEAALARREG